MPDNRVTGPVSDPVTKAIRSHQLWSFGKDESGIKCWKLFVDSGGPRLKSGPLTSEHSVALIKIFKDAGIKCAAQAAVSGSAGEWHLCLYRCDALKPYYTLLNEKAKALGIE